MQPCSRSWMSMRASTSSRPKRMKKARSELCSWPSWASPMWSAASSSHLLSCSSATCYVHLHANFQPIRATEHVAHMPCLIRHHGARHDDCNHNSHQCCSSQCVQCVPRAVPVQMLMVSSSCDVFITAHRHALQELPIMSSNASAAVTAFSTILALVCLY